MRNLLLIIALTFSFTANATSLAKYTKQHKEKKQQLFASLDYCSNLGNKDIFELGTKDLEEIYTYRTKVEGKFSKIKQQKTNCFDNSLNYLNDIIAENLVFMQENSNSELFELQNRVDERLYESTKLRKTINIELIDSIWADTQKSFIKTAPEKRKDSFITESSKTKQLISQELNIVYNSLEDQLQLDQSNIDTADNPELTQVANVTLRSAFLNLSRALLLFENIEKEPKAYNIAKINTYLETANNKFLELKSFSEDLDGLDSKKDINSIINKLYIITVDLDVTIKEISEDSFSDNFLNWAGNLYQQTSDLATQTQKILDTIYLIDMTKQAMPIDITIKEEKLDFNEVKAIQAPSKVLQPVEETKKTSSKTSANKGL
jgi:hypothetical protein